MVIQTIRYVYPEAPATYGGRRHARSLMILWAALFSIATTTGLSTFALGIEPTAPAFQDPDQEAGEFSIREIDLDDAACDQLARDEQAHQKFLAESNQSQVFRLRKVVVFGDSPVTITRRLQIRKENGAPARILAIQSSCGCFSASVDNTDFSQSRDATIEFKIIANPSASLHQKELSVKVFLENGFELDCRTLLTMYPSIRVVKNPNSRLDTTLAVNDAGTLVVKPDQAGNYEVEIGLACVQEDPQNLNADKFVLKRVLPDNVHISFRPQNDAQPIPEGEEPSGNHFERRFLATVSGNLSDHETQPVQFDVALAGGEPRSFFVTIQRREILRINRSGLLLSPDDLESTFTVQRTDGAPLSIASIEYDAKYLRVERLDTRDPTERPIHVVLRRVPNKPLWRNKVKVLAHDGQTKEIKIIVLNPQTSPMEKE